MKPVAVTGLGAICAAGPTAEAMWDAVAAGNTAIGPVEVRRQELVGSPVGAQFRDYDADAHFDSKALAMMDRVSQFAVIAARQALADAGLANDDPDVAASPVVIGVGAPGLETLDDSFYKFYGQGGHRAHPLTVPRLMASAPASQVTMDLGLHGSSFTVSSACASGVHAIGQACRTIQYGESPYALAGGSEACLTAGTLLGWQALRVLSTDTCRPFSRNRSGLVLGEGAGMLVLEDLDHAVARGATIRGVITGFGANADAADLTSPDLANVARAMRLALAEAGLQPGDIDYINAHGTGTLMNDAVEAEALREVFGGRVPPVSSSKGVLGHTLGAAGALEAVIALMAIERQVAPPTANCTEPDESLGIDMIADGARQLEIRHALSNSFAFGGLNAVLAFSRYPAGFA